MIFKSLMTRTFKGMINSESFQNGFIAMKNGCVAQLDFDVDFDGMIHDGDELILKRQFLGFEQDVISIKFEDKTKEGLYFDYEVKILGEEFDFVKFEGAVADDDCLIGFFAKNYGLTIVEENGGSPLVLLNSAKIADKKEGLVNTPSYQYLYSMVLFEDTLILNTDTFSSLNPEEKIHCNPIKIEVKDITTLSLDIIADRGILTIKTGRKKLIGVIDFTSFDTKLKIFLQEVNARRCPELTSKS